MRWDPNARAGAMGVKRRTLHDVSAMRDVTSALNDWARYQNLVGETDQVEPSKVRGTYTWLSYLQEETEFAQRREADRAKPGKKSDARAPPAVPTHLYA